MADPVQKFAVPIDMLGLPIRRVAAPQAPDDVGTKGHTESTADAARVAAIADILARRGIPSGFATLDAQGKLVVAQLPALAITDTFVVFSEEEMLALTAERGDVAIRQDSEEDYILAGDDPADINAWKRLHRASGVRSVDDMTGSVTLAYASDIGDGVATSFDIEHGLGTRDVQVSVLDIADDYADVVCRVTRPDFDRVRIEVAVPPAANALRVVVQR